VTNRDKSAPDLDAKWRVDRDLRAARERYPQHLPLTHIALLSGWETKLRPINGMLAGCTPDEFEQLSPLPKQLEVNRARAESALVRDRAGQSELSADDRERLTRRALGILPTEESARLLEVASCRDFRPAFYHNPAFVPGIPVENDMGRRRCVRFPAMPGRSNDDCVSRDVSAALAAVDEGPIQQQLKHDNSGLFPDDERGSDVHASATAWHGDARARSAFSLHQC